MDASGALQSSLPGIGGERRKRPDRVTQYMNMAKLIARRSTCNRAQVGSVIIDTGGRVLSTGYNGNLPSVPHCLDIGCYVQNNHCITTIHAEMNAILRMPSLYSHAGSLYCTHEPCLSCIKAAITRGIHYFLFEIPYIDPDRDAFLEFYKKNCNLGLYYKRVEEKDGIYSPVG